MLHGRESLVRLVGKRRRTLSIPQNPLYTSPEYENSGARDQPSSSSAEVEAMPSRKDGVQIYETDWVSCPVCGSSIRGTDYSVNSHLDSCLARGTKRKLKQCSLLQFVFDTGSRSESILADSDIEEDTWRELIDKDEPSNSPALLDSISIGNNDIDYCPKPDYVDHFPSNSGVCAETSLESTVNEDAVSTKAVSRCHSYKSSQSFKMPKLITCGAKDAHSLATLETFIVGRKFHGSVELQLGMGVSILRDPQNAKDSLAIKVLSADSGFAQVLGYLPRELAKYLSPLIDNYYIECEGFVISLPKHPLDIVPIQLVCRKSLASNQMEPDDSQTSESLWENVHLAVEHGKTHPPSMTKYQQNFRLMIGDVMDHHAYLFTEKEKSFIGSFNTLSDDGQRLFIRLYTRKGPWFRSSNISYPEISYPQKAIVELKLAGYVYLFHSSDDPFMYDMKEVLDVLHVSEMREISNLEFSKNGINCTRRQDFLNVLLLAYENGTCPLLPKLVLDRTGTCVRISSAADILLWRVQRLFFLNGEQDLSAFLLVDLGLIKFPDYICNVSRRIFQDRKDLLEYEEAIEVAQKMDESLEENNMEMVMRCINLSHSRMRTEISEQTQSSLSVCAPTCFSCFSASWVYSNVITLGVSVFEREHRYEDAIRLLKGLLSLITCDSRRGHWTLRLSVDLEHVGRLNESLSVAEEGVQDPWVRAGSKIALQRRVLRLGKPPRRWKKPSYADSVKRKIKEVNIMGRPLASKIGEKNLFYGYDGELCGVEQLALQYYAGEGGGWQGVHSESGIWMTIFGLLMWDIIFADVPDVFRSRFQIAPLDLGADDFYAARKDLIESQLQKIRDGMAEEILITSWELHTSTACRGVNWERHSLSDLRAVVSCIGGNCLASLCRHLALDYRSWSSGMPDLLLWRFHGGFESGGEAKLVEVKGPRDRLSEQQRAWMLILMDCGFNTEVCRVSLNSKSQ